MTGPSSLLTDTNWLNLCIFPVPSHIHLHYLHSISGALSEAAEITLGPKKLKDPKDCHNYSKISVPSSFCPTMLIFHTLLRVKRPLFIILKSRKVFGVPFNWLSNASLQCITSLDSTGADSAAHCWTLLCGGWSKYLRELCVPSENWKPQYLPLK